MKTLFSNRCLLKKPNYVYKINPFNFEPVVTLLRDENDNSYFEFSNEWISQQIVDLNDRSQLIGFEMITDITDLLKYYQVFCDIKNMGIAPRIKKMGNIHEALSLVCQCVDLGCLRYINGEANINSFSLHDKDEIINKFGIKK